MRAARTTPRLNQSYELRPPWEQHLRYVPHWVRNGYNNVVCNFDMFMFSYVFVICQLCLIETDGLMSVM